LLDFFLWGYVSVQVNAAHVPDLPMLQIRIHDVTMGFFMPPMSQMLKFTKLHKQLTLQ
jgi:hypothetical protein